MRTEAARAAFTEHLGADMYRLAVVVMGTLLIALCLRVAWLRFRAPDGDPRREGSSWALLSYALFASIPTVRGWASFGSPLTGWSSVVYVVALVSGVVAAFGQVTLRRWRWWPSRKERE